MIQCPHSLDNFNIIDKQSLTISGTYSLIIWNSVEWTEKWTMKFSCQMIDVLVLPIFGSDKKITCLIRQKLLCQNKMNLRTWSRIIKMIRFQMAVLMMYSQHKHVIFQKRLCHILKIALRIICLIRRLLPKTAMLIISKLFKLISRDVMLKPYFLRLFLDSIQVYNTNINFYQIKQNRFYYHLFRNSNLFFSKWV